MAALAFVARASAQDDFKRTAKGTIYRIVTSNPGEKIKLDQIITFNMVQKTEEGFNTGKHLFGGKAFFRQGVRSLMAT